MKRWFVSDSSNSASGWRADVEDDGLLYTKTFSPGTLQTPLIESALVQWADDGHVTEQPTGWLLPWDSVYALAAEQKSKDALDLLGFPAEVGIAPRLVSKGSLVDRDFVVATAGWVDGNGRSFHEGPVRGATVLVGGQTRLMPKATWLLLEEVAKFATRTEEQRDEKSQRIGWGKIRALALDADAALDRFLLDTVVLTPERLKIRLRKSGEGTSRVVEVTPDFADAPEQWLKSFDTYATVRDRYDLPTANGIVQIVVRPEVREVLEQIKRLPGRRVAGARAEAFVTNPFAALGASASQVIDPTEFEEERERAGLVFDRFTAYLLRDKNGSLIDFGLLVENAGSADQKSLRLSMVKESIPDFVGEVSSSIAQGRQIHAWQEFEFELLGNVEQELDQLTLAAREWSDQQRRPAYISFDSIYDLSNYSERIQGFGEEQPYLSPYIARKDDKAGWFPDNIVNVIELPPEESGGEPRYITLTPEEIEELRRRAEEARASGQTTIEVPGVTQPVPIDNVEEVVKAFVGMAKKAAEGKFDPVQEKASEKRNGLVVKPNISLLEYHERRAEILQKVAKAQLPGSLRTTIQLKAHQVEGVAWLQRLFNCSPTDCRGGLLADDMGLGKTLQLLTLIAWAHEQNPKLEPALIVAPVALLENWKEEAQKFFKGGALNILEVYGDMLSGLRVPKHEIDEQLKQEGLVKFLKNGWRGRANVVLTTYETLRDLEFSFAAEKWSVFVCDEAQKVKNPNALVTRAVKKQNARFRVACTGTPVENTLADLWCLFDFIQPGLLGALNEFGQLYRRPIEAKTDEQKARVEELRALTKPQTLRRLKSEVARDLPRKISVPDCRSLQISPNQRALYAQAIAQFAQRAAPDSSTPFKNALGLLQYLRLICTDPRPYGLSGFRAEPTEVYRKKAPKMDWLLRALVAIRDRGEKALVFCEFRDIQLLLRYHIEKELKYAADIINGDTAASSASDQSRQKRIRSFQERPGFGVIILSPLAVGFGVNIQAANHVIHYTRTWNPAKEDQATDRAFRIGQEKDVYVYCPVVRAEDFTTFDVKLDELLEHKRVLAHDMLNGGGDIASGEFNIGTVAPPECPSVQQQPLSFEDVLTMQPRHFEAYVAVLWARKGFSFVTLTPAVGDGGVDVVALNDREGELIQCKTSQRSDRELGWDAIKDVVTGTAGYARQYPGVRFKRVCVATQAFNSGARSQAVDNDVDLYDRKRLCELHGSHEITLEHVEEVLYRT